MRQDSFHHRSDKPTLALRVPFGLKDGRMWSPKQVAPGRACGCFCPACRAPLVAKATDSQHRRPHFAHFADTDCRAGYETALHLKAKELLAERLTLCLPAWDGEAQMPNPPAALDDEGQRLTGERVEYPARRVTLVSATIEQSCGDYVPDVVAIDDHGELLIEIRVSHAVDARKRRRIQAEGRRLMEIDLSRLAPDIASDEEQLAHWVLDARSNRVWLSCPEATEAWRASHRALKSALAARNQEIARARQEREAAHEAVLREQALAEAAAAKRQANKDRFRQEQRARYRQQLAELPALVSPARIQALLAEYERRDGPRAERLIAAISSEGVKREIRLHSPNAWIYEVHPMLWQAATYHWFIQRQAAVPQFNQRQVARWVMQEFGREQTLYELFMAQYAARDRARKAGFRKQQISHWAFTEPENRQIPNFYSPVNTFIDRLIYVGALDRVLGVRGEVRVPSEGSRRVYALSG